MKNFYIDLGSSTIKIYCFENELKLLEEHSIYFKNDFDAEKGISDYESYFLNKTIFDQSEQTSVTKMERRIFDLDISKLKNNVHINTPSSLYLNFFQHLELDYKGEIGVFDDYCFNRYLREYFNWLESETGVEIYALGTGAKNGERILKKNLVKDIQKKNCNEIK